MDAPEKQHLFASTVGEYVLIDEQVHARRKLNLAANNIPNFTTRANYLGRIAAAHDVIVWHVSGLTELQLDDRQKQRLIQFSQGYKTTERETLNSTSKSTEGRRTNRIQDLLGEQGAAVTTGICLGIIPLERQKTPNTYWPTGETLKLCRLLGLGLSNRMIGKQLGNVSEKAVASRLSRTVYRPLGLETARHAVRRLFELGVFWRLSEVVDPPKIQL